MNTPGKDKPLHELEAEMLAYKGDDRIVSLKEWFEIQETKPKPQMSFKTGIGKLDELINGFETGELITVSGPSGHGKTTLCETISNNIRANGGNVLFFSFEVPLTQLLKKYENEQNTPLYVPLEAMPGNVAWLEKKVVEAKLKYNCRVVFIDHLHFIVDMFSKNNISIDIGRAMRSLKTNIALKHNVAVFLIAHVKHIKFTDEPDASDIRDSSFIAQESDTVLMVWRRLDEGKDPKDDDAYSDKGRVMICKARRTGVLKKRIDTIKKGNFFYEDCLGFPVTEVEEPAF